MQTKPLLYGLIGFMLGGLLVSTVATKLKSEPANNGMTNTTMVSSLQGKTGDDYDAMFVSEMIKHHQDAVDMAKMSEAQAKHQEVKDLSKSIVDAQQKEITQMRQWQAQWDYSEAQTDDMR